MPSRPSTSTDSASISSPSASRVLGERGRREVVAGPVLQIARAVRPPRPPSPPRRRPSRAPPPGRAGTAMISSPGAWAARRRPRPRRERTCAGRSGSRRGSCPRTSAAAMAALGRRLGACRQSARGRDLKRALADRRGHRARALGREARARAQPHGQPALAVGVGQRERLERAPGLAGVEQLAELARVRPRAAPRPRTRRRRPCRRRSPRPAAWCRIPHGPGTISGRGGGSGRRRACTPWTGARGHARRPTIADLLSRSTTPGEPRSHAQDRDPRRRAHPHRQDGRRPVHAGRHRARRPRDRGRAGARRAWSPSRSITS